jgi:hypothetical protein
MIYNWYHRQFWQTAKKRYLSDAAVREKLHGVLSTYFTNSIPPSLEHEQRQISPQPMLLNSTSVWSDDFTVNRRRIVEASYHLLHAGKDYFNDAVNELCDIDNICAFIMTGHYTYLLQYYAFNYVAIYIILNMLLCIACIILLTTYYSALYYITCILLHILHTQYTRIRLPYILYKLIS